jgi:hypothetical protein
VIQIYRYDWLAFITLVVCLTGCAVESTPLPPAPTQSKEVSIADLEIVTGQTIYVPAYSDIYFAADRTIDLAITLTVHNTDLTHPIVLTSVRYYNTQGQLIRDYIAQPRQLGPLETAAFFVEESDDSGGVGANFIVVWGAEQPAYEPVVEAVMIGSVSSLSFSFVTPGRVITQTGSFTE